MDVVAGQHLCRALWWKVNYEEVYLKNYETSREDTGELAHYFVFYNERRLF
jgi:hypothetical protein